MRSGLADESDSGQTLGVVLGEGNSDPRSALVPELGSGDRTAGEGGRVSSGAQAQPLCKITLHSYSYPVSAHATT